MRVLFLDDMEVRHHRALRVYFKHTVVEAWTARQAIDAMKKERFDVVCLDHDLEEERYEEHTADGMLANGGTGDRLKGSGAEVAQFMAVELAAELRPHHVVIHSLNDYGANRMAGILKDAGYPSIERKPFTRWGT